MNTTAPRAEKAPARRIALAPEPWLWLGLALTLLTFAATLRFEFVYDDLPQIVSNPAVQSWRHAPGYFRHEVWSHIHPAGGGNYYRPLFLLWLLINHTLFGLNPAGWHAAALGSHLAATAAVFFLARRLCGDAPTAGIAATLFGVHPAHIETVAWVSAAGDSLMATLAIGSYLRFAAAGEGRRARNLALSAGLFGLALLVKEPAIVLPALLAAQAWLWDAGRGAERVRRVALSVAPHLAVAAAYVGVRIYVLGGVAPSRAASAAEALFTVPSVAWLYLRHLFWPAGLSLFYDTPLVTRPGMANFVAPLLACLAAAFVAAAAARRSRAAGMGLAWLCAFAAPALAAIPALGAADMAHDRYLYVPSAGFCLLLAMAIRALPVSGASLLGLPRGQAMVVLAAALLLAAGSVRESVQWANNLLLFHRAVQAAPRNPLARLGLASAMMGRGEVATGLRLYREARELAPNDWLPNFLLGYASYGFGRYADAELYLRTAAGISGESAAQFVYWGLALQQLGRPEEAAAALRRGIALHPRAAGLHFALGRIEQQRGNLAGARQQYEAELGIDPSSGARQALVEMERQAAPAPRR